MSVTRLLALGLFSVACTEVEIPTVDEPSLRQAREWTTWRLWAPRPAPRKSPLATECTSRLPPPEGLGLTQTGPDETIYTTYLRIDAIASAFEACGDPWGMFPTTYRHITDRIIEAIENQEIEDSEWASRSSSTTGATSTTSRPLWLVVSSYAWAHYYKLADDPDVSRARAVVVAMVAHLTLDLPYALHAIDTDDSHAEDYFVLGGPMIEITPNFIDELNHHYDADTEDLLNGFFFGRWVDGAFGRDTTITLSYQTIRTKSWNNWRLINAGWGWTADTEIWAAFWALDGVLATLDAAGTI